VADGGQHGRDADGKPLLALKKLEKSLEEQGGDGRKLALFGQDDAATVWSICKMNMIMHDIKDADIQHGDTLMEPYWQKNGSVRQFDRVIANPPFSQNYTKNDKMKCQNRFVYGWAPQTGKKADLMFVQHMIASTKPDGMMITVMPHGVLFRGGAEKTIRKGIIRILSDDTRIVLLRLLKRVTIIRIVIFLTTILLMN